MCVRAEDTTTDEEEEEEEEERPHGRLTGFHGRDLADVPRGQVLVEGLGTGKHYEEEGAEETSVRGEEEREGGTPIREEHRRRERERRESGEREV